MSPDKIEKIGSKSLLDKHWGEQPLGIIKNPHKLTEIELYKTLEKIVELPEKRVKTMLKAGNHAVQRKLEPVAALNIQRHLCHFPKKVEQYGNHKHRGQSAEHLCSVIWFFHAQA